MQEKQAACLPLLTYFGAREATIFSKHGSPRSGPHNGSSFQFVMAEEDWWTDGSSVPFTERGGTRQGRPSILFDRRLGVYAPPARYCFTMEPPTTMPVLGSVPIYLSSFPPAPITKWRRWPGGQVMVPVPSAFTVYVPVKRGFRLQSALTMTPTLKWKAARAVKPPAPLNVYKPTSYTAPKPLMGCGTGSNAPGCVGLTG